MDAAAAKVEANDHSAQTTARRFPGVTGGKRFGRQGAADQNMKKVCSDASKLSTEQIKGISTQVHICLKASSQLILNSRSLMWWKNISGSFGLPAMLGKESPALLGGEGGSAMVRLAQIQVQQLHRAKLRPYYREWQRRLHLMLIMSFSPYSLWKVAKFKHESCLASTGHVLCCCPNLCSRSAFSWYWCCNHSVGKNVCVMWDVHAQTTDVAAEINWCLIIHACSLLLQMVKHMLFAGRTSSNDPSSQQNPSLRSLNDAIPMES